MVSALRIKKLAKKDGKRISKKALEKIGSVLEKKAEEIIRKAKRNADLSGRKTIKEEDIPEI